MAFRILAAVLFVMGTLFAFGWLFDTDPARGVGCIAAGLLCLVLSTVPVGPVAWVDGTRLVTAVDIAAARVRDMPTGTIAQSLAKSARYQIEVRKAKAELASGEWSPEDVSPLSETAA